MRVPCLHEISPPESTQSKENLFSETNLWKQSMERMRCLEVLFIFSPIRNFILNLNYNHSKPSINYILKVNQNST